MAEFGSLYRLLKPWRELISKRCFDSMRSPMSTLGSKPFPYPGLQWRCHTNSSGKEDKETLVHTPLPRNLFIRHHLYLNLFRSSLVFHLSSSSKEYASLHCDYWHLVIFYRRIDVTFVTKDGSEKTIKVSEGTNMLEAAHDNDIDLEGMSCILSGSVLH